MAEHHIIKLTGLTPLHIGTGRENYDFSASVLHSDTIASALSSIKAGSDTGSDIESFLNSFAVSSAFPFWKGLYFLPKPQGKMDGIKVSGQEIHQYRKSLKRLKYIELSLWQEIISGKTVTVDANQICGQYLLPPIDALSLNISKTQVSERVSVPRNGGQDAEPFYFEWKYFDKEAGLYCIVEADNRQIGELERLFRILGEEGIGTDRNIGGGKFDIVSDSITINAPSNSDSTLLLSLYIPDSEEFQKIDLTHSRYNLLLRGGYISGSNEETLRHIRKRSIYMFDVGSVFPGLSGFEGKVVNLRPEWNDDRMHDVFRSGRPVVLPIKA